MINDEFRPDANYEPWGPFIGKNFKNEPITNKDVVISSVAWALTIINIFIATLLAYKQTKSSRSPLRSGYVWMIWIELLVCLLMGLQTYLLLTKVVRPSFAVHFSNVIYWCIQVQLLLQIIINRIRIILPDRRRSRMIMIGTAIIVGIINLSVCIIWVPARLQINKTFMRINLVWDRVEKVIYLVMDAALNWYFLRVVEQNLIANGLQKYNRLMRFNQRIIVVSILMDFMIIGAMFIPNSLVYIMFHPLAYLVKLNIEMTMANLIKRIAISTSKRTGNANMADEFNSSSNLSSTPLSRLTSGKTSTLISLKNLAKTKKNKKPVDPPQDFALTSNQIKETREIVITSEPNNQFGNMRTENELLRGQTPDHRIGFAPSDRVIVSSKSLESVTDESAGSIKSVARSKRGDSDDEVALVIQTKTEWGRLPG